MAGPDATWPAGCCSRRAPALPTRRPASAAPAARADQGFHSAPPGDDTEALPVPTSLLIDGDGKVLWMDRAENYQRRSGPEVVLAALRRHLD